MLSAGGITRQEFFVESGRDSELFDLVITRLQVTTQIDAELGARARRGFGTDLPFDVVEATFDNRQPQTGSTLFAREEWFEQLFADFIAETDAIVFDRDLHPLRRRELASRQPGARP